MQWVVTTILQWMLKELIKLCYMDGQKIGILEMLLKILNFQFVEPICVAYLMQFLVYQVTAMFFAHLSFLEADNAYSHWIIYLSSNSCENEHLCK